MTARIASFSPQHWGQVFCLGSGLEGFGLHQRPAAGEDPAAWRDPFVRRGDSGGVATTLVGQITGGVDEPRSYGILLRSDAAVGGYSAAWGDRWFHELTRELETLTGGGEPRESPPLWYCQRRQLLFVPPCPSCGEPLAECLEDAVLTAAGLAVRTTSPQRYLFCPACAERGTPLRFYHPAGAPQGHPQVGDRGALIAGFGARAAATRDVGDPYFPCAGCSFRHACYPESTASAPGEAATVLLPLSFYGGGMVPVEVLPLSYTAAVDRLGGREPGELEELLDGPPATELFLFPAERERRLPLEALLLKLTLFDQVCAQVEACHRLLGRPHLHLTPETVRVSLGAGAGAAPAGWRSRVRLIGLDGACPEPAAGEGEGTFLPPLQGDLAYAHPGVAVGPSRDAWLPGRFAVGEVAADAGGGWVVEGVLETERIRAGEVGPADTFQIGLGPGLGFRSEILLSCSCQGSGAPGVVLRSAPVSLEPADRERLASLKALPQVEARFTLARRYGVECDLFSLGMLLLRGVLVNRDQALDAVSQRCRTWAGELERHAVSSDAGPGVEEVLEGMWTDPLFAAGNVLWEPLPPGVTPLPRALWRETLELGFRLLAGIPGFSFAAGASGAGLGEGAAVGRVRSEVQRLLATLREALFPWQPEPVAELRAVLAEAIDDAGWLDRMLGAGSDAPPPAVPAAPAPPVESAAASSAPADLDATVVLRPGQVADALAAARQPAAASSVSAPGPAPVPPPAPAAPGLDETVILRRSPGGGVPTVVPVAPVGGGESENTEILGPGGAAGQPEGADLEKTVILRRGKPAGGG